MIKAIIFDYGGVIGNDPSEFIYKAVSKEFGLDTNKIKNEFFKFIIPVEKNQIPETIFWKKLAKNLDITDYRKLRRIWVREFKKHAEVNKKVLSLINKLKSRYKLCLLSNNAVFYQKDSIVKSLKKIFSVIIYSFDVKMRKPEKKIYLYTIKRLKSKPEECLIIDDSKSKLIYPRKLGMETIYFKSFSQFKKEFFNKLNGHKT